MSFIEDFWDNNGDAIIDVLIRICIALVTLVVGVYVIRWLTSILHRVFESNKRLDPTVAGFFLSIFKFALRFILLIIVFDQLGIENTSFIAIAGASVFALAFALQGSLSNLAAGALLLSFRYLKVGDLVEVAGETGFTRRVEMFTSQVVTPDGKLIIIPNSSVTGNNIVNYSTLNAMRLPLAIGIDYGDDIHLARKVALDVMRNNEMVLDNPAPTAVVVELGDNSVNFEVRPWVEARHYYRAMVQILEELKLAFDEAGLSIPFPQRDVHLNLVDTETEPKTYPDWVPLKMRPGGPDHFFHRKKRDATEVFKLLQLSAADQERLREEAAADDAAAAEADKKRAAQFGSIDEGDESAADESVTSGRPTSPTSEPRPVRDLDAELEALDIDDDESDSKDDENLRTRTSSSAKSSSQAELNRQ